MSDQKIELYKIRDFGQKINATIVYIRRYIKHLIVPVLLLILPAALLAGFFIKDYMATAMSFGAMDDPEVFNSWFSEVLVSYLGMMLVSLIAGALFFMIIYEFMTYVSKEDTIPTVGKLYSEPLGRLPGLMGLFLIIGIISTMGFFFFIIPGFYLAIVLSLATPIYLFEKASIGASISKSFKIIKGKWWSTFGILMITTIIAGAVSYIFILPSYALMFWEAFTSAAQNPEDPEAIAQAFGGWTFALGVTLAMIGTYICYIIPIIALAFQYFNLVERHEGRGLKQEIANFENIK